MKLNEKGMSFAGFVLFLGVIALAVWFLKPYALAFVEDSNTSLFVNASLAGSNYLSVQEMYNYDAPITEDEARLFNFSELEISNFDHTKFDMTSSYVLAVLQEGTTLQYDYYINFKTHDDLDSYKQIVMTKSEDVKRSAITYDKELWQEIPVVGDYVEIEGKQYKVI